MKSLEKALQRVEKIKIFVPMLTLHHMKDDEQVAVESFPGGHPFTNDVGSFGWTLWKNAGGENIVTLERSWISSRDKLIDWINRSDEDFLHRNDCTDLVSVVWQRLHHVKYRNDRYQTIDADSGIVSLSVQTVHFPNRNIPDIWKKVLTVRSFQE